MKTLAPALPWLACLAIARLSLACNTPPKDPPPNGPEVPAPTAAADAARPPVAIATPTATATAPTATATATATAPATASAPSASSAVGAKPASCTSDGDCRTFSSYCTEAPCACKVLKKSDADPKCQGSGPQVSCFVDPCLKKAAHCQSGACVLTSAPGKGPAGATEK